ncbi:MAG: VWA domain-containing protein [Spirochaetes bacterium]|nr:VWA domain-containing protein [Spirochaetota bacterium]
MKKLICFGIMFISAGILFAADPVISQIDTSDLFVSQKINMYVNISDRKGVPVTTLSGSDIEIYESSSADKDREIRINDEDISIQSNVNQNNGINFYLMVDNSGSMYMGMNGKSTSKESEQRINLAREAVNSFLKDIDNSSDKVGLASYNTNFNSYSVPSSNIDKISGFLEEIEKPDAENRYTEIYASLSSSVDEFRDIQGRKVIIILTDGENQPFYKLTGKVHPVFGTKTYDYKEPIELCNEEGISVFPIYFGPSSGMKDKYLDEIAKGTGGRVFNANNRRDLQNVYRDIRTQILNEFLITYKATMIPANKKNVRLVYKYNNDSGQNERYYFSGSVLGLPLKVFSLLLLLPFILALLLFGILSKLKFENKNNGAYLELLDRGVAKVSTKVFSLDRAKTVIGGSDNADMTIIGKNNNIKNNHATIVFDKTRNCYTIVSEGLTKVNNRTVKTKVLEPGDVINVCGTTVVFDNNRK